MDNSQCSLLKKEEVERYCRQVILPEIGPEGQQLISNAKVLVVGAGGLGSPCVMYLAGAGIGVIGIIDGDCVDTSNLHRQVIHPTNNKGINKARSAGLYIQSLNPNTKVNVYEEHLTCKNALEICKNYDLLIDCCDNPATRYLTNDICVVLKKPLVSGSAVKWEGQLTIYTKDTINPNESNNLPCYRCLFPIPPPATTVCNCADAGVFGPVPGVIGTMQANEAIKLIIGAKDKILARRMLAYDAYEMNFKIFKLRAKKSDCIVCGDYEKRHITIDNIVEYDYDEFVNPKSSRVEKRLKIPQENNIKWTDLIENNNDNIINVIDVRSVEQFRMFRLSLNNCNILNVPLKNLMDDVESIEKNFKKEDKIFVMCRAGNLSTHAVTYLISKGFANCINLEDGIHGYIKEIDSKETPYY